MSKVARRIQRQQRVQEWEPLRNITYACSPSFLSGLRAREHAELVAVWQSALYEVYEFVQDVPEWGGPITWLSIKRRDKSAVRDWRHLQRIKNEVCGPEREAMEMFPAEQRLVDTSNQFHLWVLPEGRRFPFGYNDRAVVLGTPEADRYVPGRPRQRPFEPGLAPTDALTPEEADAILGGKVT